MAANSSGPAGRFVSLKNKSGEGAQTKNQQQNKLKRKKNIVDEITTCVQMCLCCSNK